MSRLRPLVAVVALSTALGLTACIGAPSDTPTPSPTATATDYRSVDAAAAEELMRSALPVGPDDHDVYNESGLDTTTFGSDWTDVDLDAQRVARVWRGLVSPGWSDPSFGPGYEWMAEIVLMESEDAAGVAFNAIAGATAEPYTNDSDDGTVQDSFEPLPEPSGRWPFGTVEQKVTTVWSTGQRASGWVISYLSGPFIMRASGLAVPGGDSEAALSAFTDTAGPELITAVDGLPAGLIALG